jgi:hypothetical protein
MTIRPVPRRRGVRVAALGGLLAACLTLGLAACGSGDQAGSDPAAAGQASGTTPLVQSVDAPLNAVPTSGQDPADATAPGADAPAEPLTTGTPTNTQMTALTDLPDPAPVATAGPIAPAGNIDQIVPEVPVTTAPAVGLTDTADFGGQVSARITQVNAIQAAATLPGEVSGPAVAVTLEISNSSARAIGLDSVTVTLTDAAGDPAGSIAADPAAPLSGVLDAGAAKSGTYVFTVPADQRNPVTVTATYSSGAPTLVFTGQVTGG